MTIASLGFRFNCQTAEREHAFAFSRRSWQSVMISKFAGDAAQLDAAGGIWMSRAERKRIQQPRYRWGAGYDERDRQRRETDEYRFAPRAALIAVFSKMPGGQKPEQNRARDGRYCDHIDQVLRGHRYPRVFGAAVLFFISLAFGDLSFSLGYFTLTTLLSQQRSGRKDRSENLRMKLFDGFLFPSTHTVRSLPPK
jgi:hypothetical protein